MDPAIHTFLFTDIAGSTRLWQEYPAAMAEALAIHDDVLTATIGNNRGRVFKHTGDGMAVVFAMPSDALRAAVQAQRALNDAAWPDTGQFHVRMGIHTGAAIDREGDFFGTAVNKVARLMGVGHGDQILVSDVTAGLLDAEPEWRLIDLGPHRLRDLAGSVEVFQVAADGLVKDFPPLRLEPSAQPAVVCGQGRAGRRDCQRVADDAGHHLGRYRRHGKNAPRSTGWCARVATLCRRCLVC